MQRIVQVSRASHWCTSDVCGLKLQSEEAKAGGRMLQAAVSIEELETAGKWIEKYVPKDQRSDLRLVYKAVKSGLAVHLRRKKY